MKVVITTRSEEALEEYDYNDKMTITVDGKRVFSVYDGEPEDNNMCRNFNDVMNIDTLMELAYHAGVDGEPLEIFWEDEE